MSLRCALDLGIPDAINNYGQPMNLSQIQSTLSLPSTKKPHLHRLLRMLTHIGFLREQGVSIGTEVVYGLTTMSHPVLKNEGAPSMFPLVLSHIDFITVKPSLHLGDWFKQDDGQNTFEMAHDCTFWEMTRKNPNFNKMFNDSMESTSSYMIHEFVKNVSNILKGIHTLVDVGGGTGALAKAIIHNFPHVECTVLELPHVIQSISNDGPVNFVSGDMFNFIPPADVVILKWILHDWCDEDCIKILRRCKEAISSRETGGRVIIIENVIGSTLSKTCQEAQLLTDMLMLTMFTGAERDEHEWQNLFTDAGFGSYQITHTIGFNSVIEIYP
ncbi:O-methyltransferase [Rhynchospora pubera]|uniref:O-methyltransferase n=1 Tax=Rhynchospora pubera TaxID=906938 RepID=A0AAV8H1X5_9POAL|nr:O-methyltransferase [Rhynchospora pubera]